MSTGTVFAVPVFLWRLVMPPIPPAMLLIGAAIVLVVGFMYRVAMSSAGADWKYRQHVRSVARGKGFGIAELARRIGVSTTELLNVHVSYHESWIPKRSGGSRRLLIPNPELKSLQRLILHRLLAKLRTHGAVTGFESGLSIVENAVPHVGQAVVIKLDIKDFFPTTSADRVDAYFRRVGWDAECAALLTRLTTHDGGLPQGASTSPRLSNLINFGLDESIKRFVCGRRRGVYTRYADDLTISFRRDYPRRIRGAIQFVTRCLRRDGYELNRSKVRILRQHQQQRVTGLVVNDRVNIPRHIRRKLRAIEHRLNSGRSATMTREQLDGWKSLLRMVEQRRP
jgi:RNA-directed DNA polymerase